MFRMTLDALSMVDAIDRKGSFSAAGEELHKVPSTVSYTISKLEQDLGVQLFRRNGPRVELTEAGHELLREGRELLRRAGDLECRVRRVATGWETEFRIVIDSLFSPVVLEDELNAFWGVSSAARLSVLNHTLSGCWEALVDGRADLVIATGDAPVNAGLETKKLGELPFLFCVAPFHPLAKAKQPLTATDLRHHKAVVIADTARRLPARTVGVLWDQDAFTVPDMRAKFYFQTRGLGFGFLPEPCARQAIAKGTLVSLEVEDHRPVETICLAWRRHEHGKALQWWRKRLSAEGVLDRLLKATAP